MNNIQSGGFVGASRKITSTSKLLGNDPTVLIAFGLGAAFAFGLTLGFTCTCFYDFGFYLACLSIFYLLEYLYDHTFHPKECTYESFLLTHSKEAQYAIAMAFVEYFIECLIFPSLKGNWFIVYPALVVVILAQVIRTSAMWTAGSNFHHQIREEREENHKLVTHGIYSYSRHPSYFGWFWWSIFTQVLLFNPLCIGLYAYLSWNFFDDRIKEEEETLMRFFEKDYIDYKRKVPVGIPFIN